MTIDMRDLILESSAEVREMFREAVIELTQPILDMELKRQWAMLPAEIKDKLAQERPEEYAELMKYIGGRNGKNTGRTRIRKPGMAEQKAKGY